MLVIDASVVVKVLTEERGSIVATDRLIGEPARTAPDWLKAEIASALSKKVRYGGLPIETAERSLAALAVIMPDLAPSEPLIDKALVLSVVLRHAFYDCLYLALAIDQDCMMLTADQKFFAAVAATDLKHRVELLQ